MGLYVGIDLHSTSSYIGVVDQDLKRILGRKVPNEREAILQSLLPLKNVKMKGMKGSSIDNSLLMSFGLASGPKSEKSILDPFLKSIRQFRRRHGRLSPLMRLLRFM